MTTNNLKLHNKRKGKCDIGFLIYHTSIMMKTNKKAALNPYLPGYEYIPDGEPYVFGDRVYMFGSHDESHGTDFCLNDYVCWSADIDNLGNWRYEGVIYRKNQDPLNKNSEHYLYAPDVAVGQDGRYYLYYVLDQLCVISVSVCDTPAGQYEFYGHVHNKDKAGHETLFTENIPYDPAVLVDDNGKVYLYYGFCPHFEIPWVDKSKIDGGMMVELHSDMVTVKNKPVKVLPSFKDSRGTDFYGHAYFEAPSIRKIKNMYYIVYSSENLHELCYAVSPYPDKGFEYGGIIISNGDIGYKGRMQEDSLNYIGNNHGGLVEINGQWYVFYHRHTQATQFSRQGCAEPVTLDSHGHIEQVEMTSCGLNNGPLPAKGLYSAHIACNLVGPKGSCDLGRKTGLKVTEPHFTESDNLVAEFERIQYIANIMSGTTIGYKYFFFDDSIKEIKLMLRGRGKGIVQLSTDEKCNEVIGSASIDMDTMMWQPIEMSDIDIKGVTAFYIKFLGEGTIELESIEFI